MKNNDLIQVVFTEEELTEIHSHLDALVATSTRDAPELSSEERTLYGKISGPNKLLVDKSYLIMLQNPGLIPKFVNMEEFERDFKAREDIEAMLQKLEIITRRLSDTKILLDNDNYHDTMAFYRAIRYYASEQEQMAIPIYEELKQFFPHKKKEETKTDTEKN
ncbi:hypothetical protein [Marinifilum sp.]|uniref:hypothetical protein n=1 Tax=Marinifilum sp. TaxID=2033137 RepID=UPI003BAA1DB9